MAQKDGLQRYVLILLAAVLTVTCLHYGRSILLMTLVALLLAFLVLPISRRVERVAPRWVGALTATLVLVVITLGAVFLLGWQLTRFADDLPALEKAFATKGRDLQQWFTEHTHISRRDQVKWFQGQLNEVAGSGGRVAMSMFSRTGSALASVVPLPIILFLLVLLRGRFRTFFEQLDRNGSQPTLPIAIRITKVSQRYLKGVFIVILILGALNSLGFLLLGLKYAILLGFSIAFLNVIPYVGVLIGSLFPVIIALITKESMMYAVGALGVCVVTQFLENNFITPKIVGSSVSINPLASLFALIGFGILWGVVGMVLAIPIMGMVKIVCDSVPGLKPYGFLLGEDREYPQEHVLHLPFVRSRTRRGSGPRPPIT